MLSRVLLARGLSKLEAKLVEDNNPEVTNSLQSKIADVTADLEMKSERILELKHKIAATDLKNKSKTRFDHLQTMEEAKVVVYSFLQTFSLVNVFGIFLVSNSLIFKGRPTNFVRRNCDCSRNEI